MEIWRPIPGYEGLYEASSLGRVRGLDRLVESKPGVFRLHRGKILKQQWNGRYFRVGLGRGGPKTWYLVHAVIALAFLGPRPDGEVVRHLNGNSSDNAAANLAYGTNQENCEDMLIHGTRVCGERLHSAILVEKDVQEIRRLAATGLEYHVIADMYGVSKSAIYEAYRRRTWKHVL